MVLIPILKTSMSNSLKDVKCSPRVSFNLPTDQKSIIQYLKEGDTVSKLHFVVRSISSLDTEDSLLYSWINEFKDNILFLGKEKERIVLALLNLNWYVKDASFVAAYQELVLNLVTAHVTYLRIVLSMFIRIFLTVSNQNEDLAEEEIIWLQNVHTLMKKIVELVPLSQSPFYIMLSERFPYVKSPPCILLRFVQNLLTVRSYLPSKRSSILECIIEKVIQIDVNCSRETIEIYEIRKEDENHLMDLSMEIETKAVQMAFPLAHTLDILMNCLFKYIQGACHTDAGELNWESTKKLYKEVLTCFDKLILLTHGSCHVQYLLFYMCSLKQELCDGFLDYLWKKVQNPSVAPVFRQMAVFYIGSLLSRAKYVNISTVTACFNLICNWIHRYIDAHTSEDLSVHGTFHAVCQTVFYVFAFRNKELLNMKNGYNVLRGLNFDRMVSCRLNPLRFCDRTIIQNFASIARNHQIAYVYPIIEKNNRNLLYAAFDSNAGNVAGAMIQTFFPFDPYLLRRSKQWIEPHYRIYNHAQKDEEEMFQVLIGAHLHGRKNAHTSTVSSILTLLTPLLPGYVMLGLGTWANQLPPIKTLYYAAPHPRTTWKRKHVQMMRFLHTVCLLVSRSRIC